MGSEEFECTAGSIASKTQCILTYGGSKRDIVLNYALVAINLYICIKALVIHSNSVLDKFYGNATLALGFVIAFQIILCLILGCSGISIIWCSMAGWIMSQKRQIIRSGVDDDDDDDNDNDRLSQQENRTAASSISYEKLAQRAQWVILLDLAAIIYYLVVSEMITTVAHGCALVMGACLSKLVNKHSGVTSSRATNDSTTGTNEEPLLDTTSKNS